MSSPASPAADRTLEPAAARAAIRECFPDAVAEITGFALLGSGWDHDVYRAADGWLWRFPRRQKVGRLLPEEVRVTRFAHRVLAGTGLAVPWYEHLGRPTEHFPYPFVGYREVPGVSLDRIPLQRLDLASLADALGAGLGTLHQADPRALDSFDIRRALPRAEARLRELVGMADRLEGVLPESLRGCCAPWLAGDVALPPEYKGPPRVVHADMCPDHVIVDPESGRVVGLIDFADLALGDPVRDYIGLAGWLGFERIDAVWQRHPLPFDAGDRARLVFLSRVMSLYWLAEAAEHAGDLEKHLGWVRTCFGFGPAARSTT